MSYNINIKELFKAHFGLQVGHATRFVLDKVFNQFGPIEVEEAMQSPNAVTHMGTPVWDYLIVERHTVEGTGDIFPRYDFPLEMVIEATRPKNIVETEVVAKDGEVEELMSLSNWELKLKGFIINYEADEYPEAAVRALQKVCELKSTQLPVEGAYMEVLRIRNISIHELDLPSMPGYARVQPFEIEAKGIVPFGIDEFKGVA